MSKLLSTPTLVLLLCDHVTLEREIMPSPPPPPPESTTQNNAHFNMCRGARYSIVLTVWNIRHITSCTLPLPGRWLQRRIVSGVSRNLLSGRHFYLLVILHWFIFFMVRTFKFESNSRIFMYMTLLTIIYYFSLSHCHSEVKADPSNGVSVRSKQFRCLMQTTDSYFHIPLLLYRYSARAGCNTVK
jgi:hypothetical protein